MVWGSITSMLANLITDPIKEYVVTPIKRHISYACKCDSKVKKLQDEVVQLRDKKNRLQQSVIEAMDNGEQIDKNVTRWLQRAEDAIADAEELIQWKEAAKTKCFVGFCPNLKTCYHLSKKAEEKALAIDNQLQNAAGLEPISFRSPPLEQIVEPSVFGGQALPSRGLILNQIMDKLEDPNINMIGIYDMLNQLSGLESEVIYHQVHRVIELCYENLLDEESKSLFLLCGLCSLAIIRIHSLLIYGMGLGLLKHTTTIEEARNRVLTLINKLKAKRLLLNGDTDGFVKMHDVVRDAAVSIASKLPQDFIGVGRVALRDWANQDCTRISLPFSDINDWLPIGLQRPAILGTEIFRLDFSSLCFEGIRRLKFVEFTNRHLMSQPSSLGLLTNLNALFLYRCWLNNIAVIGMLKQLELLSFSESNIFELPREIEELTQLKLLDLTNCYRLKLVPGNVISKLCLLEELYMHNGFVRWDKEGNLSLEELEKLPRLSILQMEVETHMLTPRNCRFFDGLASCEILLGNAHGRYVKYQTSKMLKLNLEGGIDFNDGIKLLLGGTKDLQLNEVRIIQSVLYDLNGEGFPRLKQLQIKNDYGLQYLIKSPMQRPCHAFPKLELLYLNNSKRMKKICDGQLAIWSFSKLRILTINNCNSLMSLFSFSSAKCLPHLQEMVIVSCNNLEDIIGEGSEEGQYNNEVTEFTQLSSLKLMNLPHLRGFCNTRDGTRKTELLFGEMVSFPNLRSLEVLECNSLKYVITSSRAECLMELQRLEISYCELMEEIILSKVVEEIEEHVTNKIVFPKLNYLKLEGLPHMKRFSSGFRFEFQSLRELSISSCHGMGSFVSKLSGGSNNNNNETDEYLFNDMVNFSDLETMEVNILNRNRYLWDEQFIADDSFSKVKSLRIEYCSKLSVVFPSNICWRFQKLETLYLFCCPRVEGIYQYPRTNFEGQSLNVESFALRDLKIWYLPLLKDIWSRDPNGASTFKNLQSVKVHSCTDLKYVFPASIASGLPQLQQLKISNCNTKVIIAKAKDEESEGIVSFRFPQLTSLQLENLHEMRSLYEGYHTFESPKLKCLGVHGGQHSILTQLLLPYVDHKFIPGVEELTIDDDGLKGIQSGDFPILFLNKLKKVTLHSLEEDSIPALIGFLMRFYSLEKLVLTQSSLEEIFLLEEHKVFSTILKLKHLELVGDDSLKNILMNDSTRFFKNLNPIFENLQTMNVEFCDCLINITPCSVSL